MSIELMAAAADLSSELSSAATETTAYDVKTPEFDPDERIDTSGSNETSEKYDPDNRIEHYELKDSVNEGEVYDPDDRVKVENADEYDMLECDATTSKSDQSALNNNESNNENSDNIGNPHQETIDGKTYYYDDNGKLYRVDNDLVPNSEYEINGYKYQTDDQGRIVSAEGTLHLKEHEGRLTIRDSIEDIGKGDQKEGDDRGHLIGDQFNGSNGLENMIPQDANINRNDFKNFENELAKKVKDGDEVTVKVEPVYERDSKRPSAIIVTYSINGEEFVKVFPNDSED